MSKIYISDALQLKSREMVCFAGAGGKTSLLLALAAESSARGKRVLITTSTKMYRWQLNLCDPVLLEDDRLSLLDRLTAAAPEKCLVAAGKGLNEEGKVNGLNPTVIDTIYIQGAFDLILVEADGARGKSLKMPGAGEPVIPAMATTVILVIGLDILGSPLTEKTVHRAELLRQITGQKEGTPITTTTVANVVRYYKDKITAKAPSSRFIIAINRADSARNEYDAEKLAAKLYSTADMVLITSAISSKPVKRIFQR